MAFEFTDRMKAIARGEDPDAAAVVDTAKTPAAESAAAGAADTVVPDDGEAGKDAGLAAGDTEVAPELGSEAVEPVAAEKPVEKPAEPSWHDADVKSLAKGYGFSDEELGEFGSKAEFTRATRLIDRQLAARRPVAESQPTEKVAGKSAEKPVETPAEKPASLVERLKAKGFDEDSIEIARQLEETNKRLTDIAESNKKITAASQEAQAQRELDYFHSIVDGLSEKRFGRSVKGGRSVPLDNASNENRRKLHEAAETIVAGINARAQATGRQPVIPSKSELIRQAEAMAFADEIRSEERDAVIKQVSAQSKNRRPVAGSRPTASGGTLQKPTSDDSIESIVARVKAGWQERSAA